VIPENSDKLLSNPKDSRIQRRVPVYSDGEVNHIAIEKVKETNFLKKIYVQELNSILGVWSNFLQNQMMPNKNSVFNKNYFPDYA
jgi:hypothetical protein